MSRYTAPRHTAPRHALLVFTLFLAPLSAFAQIQNSPVGHWLAEHPSQGGICSWWDFRPDGTLTMHVGAAITSPITRPSPDSFIAPAATATDPPVTVTYHIDGDTLHLKSTQIADQILIRVGSAPSPKDPLLGKWRPVPPATISPDPDTATRQKAMAEAIFVFGADNTETVRAPFTSIEGKWDVKTQTFHLEKQTVAYSFQRTGQKLSLAQPPDGKRTDTYLPDPIM
jgi:hypothetical protein